MLILFFTAIWALDTGAYFSGRAFGKTGFHAFSPKKTLEGAIGGTAAVMVLLVLCHWLFLSRGLFFNKIVQWQLASFDNYMFSSYYGPVMLGLIIAAAGQAGDLLESALKRDLKIKDSGSILPGHGGIYDRFDSVFLSAPLCFYFFIFYK
jgi:phosphatidate cytidylyltransferase